MSEPFKVLEEKLLRGGIAPRHVKRYLRELGEHLSDITEAQTSAGHDAPTAAARARAALGPDQELADAMLKRSDFRSLSARFPWLVFGVLPVLALSLAMPWQILVLLVVKNLSAPLCSSRWNRRCCSRAISFWCLPSCCCSYLSPGGNAFR